MTDLDEVPDVGPLRTAPEPDAAVIDELARITDDCLRDPGSIASKRMLGQIFERELDELHTPEGSSYFSERRLDRAAEEKKEREERLFMGAVGSKAGEQLGSHGIRVRTVRKDGETAGGGGYICVCQDGAGRRYEARFGLELAERLVATGGHANLVERMGHAVARAILGERDNYFARMGASGSES